MRKSTAYWRFSDRSRTFSAELYYPCWLVLDGSHWCHDWFKNKPKKQLTSCFLPLLIPYWLIYYLDMYPFSIMWHLCIPVLSDCVRQWSSQRQNRGLWFAASWSCRKASRWRPTVSTLMRSSAPSTGSPLSYVTSEQSATGKVCIYPAFL